jgi:K+-sensing histidine kinase KdpD
MAVCYQPLVLAVSGAFGLGPGLVTSLASVAAFNWFFVPPAGAFTVADERNWVT